MKKIITLLFLLFSLFALAQPGTLDTSFDPGQDLGDVVTLYTSKIQNDGKIIIGGWFANYNKNLNRGIVRINTDGSLDNTFDSGKGLDDLTFSGIRSIGIQVDGKILIAGAFKSYNGVVRNNIARINSNGSLDTTFNPGICTDGPILAIVLQANGKILIAGDFSTYNGISRNNIARINADGSLDTTFNPGTGTTNAIRAITLQADGKILIGGDFYNYNGTTRNNFARINTDGSIDNSFYSSYSPFIHIYSVLIQSDGKILFGGQSGLEQSITARLDANGVYESIFNIGTSRNDSVLSISQQSDGKIIIGGFFSSYNGVARNGIVRINMDGSLDATFNPEIDGNSSAVGSVAIQSNGQIIITGSFISYNGIARNGIARINGGIALSTTTLKKNELKIYPNPVENVFNFECDKNITSLRLVNMSGQVVIKKKLNEMSGQVDVSSLPSGSYILKFTTESGESTVKLIKK